MFANIFNDQMLMCGIIDIIKINSIVDIWNIAKYSANITQFIKRNLRRLFSIAVR